MISTSASMQDMRRMIGREIPLEQYHLNVRRAATQVSGVSSYGSCLVTCSDELQGPTRKSFGRDVAAPLTSSVGGGRERFFAVSNLCGRLEPGAFALIDDHFSLHSMARGARLLVLEIASHVGRLKVNRQPVYGHAERFGRSSPCCGGLTLLLNPPAITGTVRHPWFEQLNSFFGPVRIEALRQRDGATRMIAAAAVHAALQAESALADVLIQPPDVDTHVLIVAGVTVNQQWSDGFLPVAYHHIYANEGQARIVGGFSLRTTPQALDINLSRYRIDIDSGSAMESAPRIRRLTTREAAALPRPQPKRDASTDDDSNRDDSGRDDSRGGERAADESAIEDGAALAGTAHSHDGPHLDAALAQVAAVRNDPVAWRTYARPILRGLFRTLSVTEPELGLATLLYDSGHKLAAEHKLHELLANGPSTPIGRRTLHEIEAELQQLNHEDAQQVLDILLASKGKAA